MTVGRTAPPGLLVRLARVQGVIFDVDGCLTLSDIPGGHHGEALPGAADALAAVRHSGRSLLIVTNASNRTPAEVAAGLRDAGLPVATRDVLTPPVVAAEVIRQRYGDRPVLAFGGSGLLDVLVAAGIGLAGHDEPERAAAVVIGWDTAFDRSRMQCAAEAIWAGADFLVTSDARRFPSRTRPLAGVGGFIAHGLSYVTGRPYEVVGKPSRFAMEAAARRLGAPPDRLLVVGDDLTLDTRMARAAGALAVLVTTGLHGRDDAAAAPVQDQPDLVIDRLADLAGLVRQARYSPATG
jgi:HAD superfamily hydrolase (TIGR01450 family)